MGLRINNMIEISVLAYNIVTMGGYICLSSSVDSNCLEHDGYSSDDVLLQLRFNIGFLYT